MQNIQPKSSPKFLTQGPGHFRTAGNAGLIPPTTRGRNGISTRSMNPATAAHITARHGADGRRGGHDAAKRHVARSQCSRARERGVDCESTTGYDREHGQSLRGATEVSNPRERDVAWLDRSEHGH